MAYGRHTRLVAGIDAASKGEAIENLPSCKPNSLPDFVPAVKEIEALSYPYIEAFSRVVYRPVAEFEALDPAGLNKELCDQLRSVASVKRALFKTSDNVGTSSKKLKMAFVASDDDDGDDLDGLYENLPLENGPLFTDAGGSSSGL
ncbi:hypothetical protein Hanom_Chr00s000005g01612701 [Helianthus anomalus]